MIQEEENILKEMDQVLDLLIENAQKLNEISRHVTVEEELVSLQSEQQDLLSNLLILDDRYHQKSSKGSDKPTPMQKKINEKLEVFQRLNSSFVDHIVSTHGLIQFEEGQGKPKVKNNSKKRQTLNL